MERRAIPALIDGKEDEVELPPIRTIWRAYRSGREVEVYPDAEAARPHEQILVDLISVLRLKPFPFRRCATCSRIFVGRKRGKPALYCSRQCKLKGSPSAATKAQYMKGRRDRNRRMETAAAIEAIRDCPEGEQLDRLARSVGRGKTRRALVFLLKRARAASRSASQPDG